MIRLWHFTLVVCFAVLALFANVRYAAAQDDPNQSAAARTFFEEGVVLAEQGQWKDAADRFRRALALRDSPVIRFNLAAALAELDQVVEASELLRALLRSPGIDPAVQAQAEERLAHVTPRIAKLLVQIANQAQASGIELNGRALPPALVGVAMPVDPGSHTARLLRDGSQIDLQQVDLGPGESGTLTLTSKVPSPEQTARSAVQEPAPLPVLLASVSAKPQQDSSAADQRQKRVWWGIGGGSVALVAGAVIAGVLLAQRSKDAHPYDGNFEPGSVSVKVNP